MTHPENSLRDGLPLDPELEAAAAAVPPCGPCPADDRLLAFYRGDLNVAGEEAIRDHIASCPDCVARARDARDFAVVFGPATMPAPVGAWRRTTWLGVAAALAGLAIVGVWSVRLRPASPPAGPTPAIAWSDLAVIPAPYEASVAPGGTGGDVVYRNGAAVDPFAAAMTLYSAGDYAAAETALESLVAARAGGEQARFYLAVTRLINGRAEDARRELAALEASGASIDRDQVSWYFAVALLKTGRVAEARGRLETIVATGAAHAVEARALLNRLEHGTGR